MVVVGVDLVGMARRWWRRGRHGVVVITEGGVPLGRPTGGGGRTRAAVGGSGGGANRGAWGHLP